MKPLLISSADFDEITRLIAASKQHATQAVNTVLIDFLTRHDSFPIRLRRFFENDRDDEKVAALLRPLRNITFSCLHEFYQMNIINRGDAA